VGFEPTVPASERVKTVHALDHIRHAILVQKLSQKDAKKRKSGSYKRVSDAFILANVDLLMQRPTIISVCT
jgi:hypothetical protein